MKPKSDSSINKIPLHDSKGKKISALELNKEIFTGKPNESLLYQAIRMYQANKRKGNASTKTRSDVRGGGKKPWKQKGTGRARTSSIRNPIWRGGGIVFGPHPRDFRYDLPKKMKKNALLSSLNAKIKSGKLIAIEDATVAEPKTKLVSERLKGLGITERALLLTEKSDRNLFLACRNIKNLTLKRLSDVTALDVLSNTHVIMTRAAFETINKGAEQ